MITSAQIKEHKFDSASDGAYTAESVDSYMDELSAEFDSLYSENREIIKRLSVFAKKIEDYKRNESVVADTLLTAQKSASSTIAGAADVVDKMLESAKAQGKKIIEAAHREADSIKLDRDVIITEAQKTAQEITKNAAENAQNIIASADKKSREITEKAQSEADGMLEEAKNNTDEYIKQANEENEIEIADRLDKAQERLDNAQNLLDEANSVFESAKSDAQKLLSQAKLDADEIRKNALKEAEEKARDIIAEAEAKRENIIKTANDAVSEVPSREGEDSDNATEQAVENNSDGEQVAESSDRESADDIAVEVEAEKIGNVNNENDIEIIKEEESVYSDSDVEVINEEIDEISDADASVATDDNVSVGENGDSLNEDENSDEADEFFSDDWNDVNIIENEVPAAVDSFTLDMNAFGDDEPFEEKETPESAYGESETTEEKTTEAEAFNAETDEEKTDEAKDEKKIEENSSADMRSVLNSETDGDSGVKKDTVNPFDATGSDNIADESDVLPDFQIDFSIFEEDPDKEKKTSKKKDEKKSSKKSKRSSKHK